MPPSRPGSGTGGEAGLLARLRQGDEAAYRDLFRRHHPILLALARTIVGDRGTAEEVVQETWLAAIAGIGAFEGRAALATWLASICLNKARTRARREGRFKLFAELAAAEADGADFPPERFVEDGHWAGRITAWDPIDPERIVGGRQLWSMMVELVEELPPVQRAVLILRDVEGRDRREVAELLDIPDGRQRVLLHRARARLRDRLALALEAQSRPT